MNEPATQPKPEAPAQQPSGAAVVCSAWLALIPQHKCGLFLTHNEHRDYYEKAADYIREGCERQSPTTWKDEEAKQRAIETDEIWELQWYPRTPIGFFHVAAPTLHELLELAKTCEG